MVIYIATIMLFGTAVFFLAGFIAEWRMRREAKNTLLEREKKEIDSILIKNLFFAIGAISPRLKKLSVMAENGWYCRHVSESLREAGLFDVLKVEEFAAYQILVSCLLVTAGCVMSVGISGLLLMAVLGLLYPCLWIYSLKRKRGAEITETLPTILDLLTLSVEAGLDFISAAVRFVEKGGDSIVAVELGRMLGEMKLGRGRSDALTEFKSRLAHPSIDSFVSMLLQAERLGASIGPILRAHAGKLRSDRFQNAERAGVAAAQKLLMPLLFCIMPAVFVVVFGPIFVMWKTGVFERLF